MKDEKIDPLTREVLWRFTEPPAKKGQIADAAAVRNDLIYALANQSSWFDKFVDENPTAEKLIEYGLSPPRLKVLVGTADKSGPEQGFEYGRDTADPDKVYARAVGKPAVFTIQRRALDRFANPDLRDRVVFRALPAADVNAVELKGWGGIQLKFEKKDGAWTGPPGQTFVVDPNKLNAFIDLLSRTPVKAFEKGPVDPKHGFGDPKLFLEAKLSWPGGALVVNLGATPDNGATYYGWSSWSPASDPVFTIDGAMFKSYKDGPSGFAK